MPLQHFQRIQRQVRIGGRAFGLGPFHRTIGGHYYTVGPLSVLQWMSLLGALRGVLFKDMDESVREVGLSPMVLAMPREVHQGLANLVTTDPIAPADLERMTGEQFAALWACLEATNDVKFILEAFAPSGAAEGVGTGLGLEDLAFAMIGKTGGAYTMRSLLELPMQEFLALADCARHLRNVSEGRPADADAPSEDETKEMRNSFGALGIEVN